MTIFFAINLHCRQIYPPMLCFRVEKRQKKKKNSLYVMGVKKSKLKNGELDKRKFACPARQKLY